MIVSVIIPAYNEERTIETVVSRVLAVDVPTEIIIVDDCSTDSTRSKAERLASNHANVTLLLHPRNLGKGAALRTGFAKATGDFVLVQDADLEYDPAEFPILLKPLIEGRADVVYGSRFLTGRERRVLFFYHYVGNRFLTLLSNMFTGLNLSDMETCYKVFRREVIQAIPIEQNRFGFEPEITAKVAKMRVRVYEVGISYSGRTYEEGKKIGWRDGFKALWCIVKYGVLPLRRVEHASEPPISE